MAIQMMMFVTSFVNTGDIRIPKHLALAPITWRSLMKEVRCGEQNNDTDSIGSETSICLNEC